MYKNKQAGDNNLSNCEVVSIERSQAVHIGDLSHLQHS